MAFASHEIEFFFFVRDKRVSQIGQHIVYDKNAIIKWMECWLDIFFLEYLVDLFFSFREKHIHQKQITGFVLRVYNFNLTLECMQSNARNQKKKNTMQSKCFSLVFFLFSNSFDFSHQYKYGFSRSMLTELMGSSRNHVVNVKPFSYGHFASGGNTTPWKEKWNVNANKMDRKWVREKVHVFCAFFPNACCWTFDWTSNTDLLLLLLIDC